MGFTWYLPSSTYDALPSGRPHYMHLPLPPAPGLFYLLASFSTSTSSYVDHFFWYPTKNKSNRLDWVDPAIDEICSRYDFQIGDSAGMRNHFIDGIQHLFSNIYAQRLNRALGKHFILYASTYASFTLNSKVDHYLYSFIFIYYAFP